MEDALRTRTVTGAETLEGRWIGGSPAHGYAGMFSCLRAASWHPSQSWWVWREDGMWSITVVGVEGGAAIPTELVAALDTITWAIPTPTTHAPAHPPRP